MGGLWADRHRAWEWWHEPILVWSTVGIVLCLVGLAVSVIGPWVVS